MAFRFVQRPEYLTVGERILFREGRTKGLGIVKAVGYDQDKPLNPKGSNDGDGYESDTVAGSSATSVTMVGDEVSGK